MVDLEKFKKDNPSAHCQLVAAELETSRKMVLALSNVLEERDTELARLKSILWEKGEFERA